MRWYRKMFFHQLDITVYNAHVLYVHWTGRREPLVDFVHELGREILLKHAKEKRCEAAT